MQQKADIWRSFLSPRLEIWVVPHMFLVGPNPRSAEKHLQHLAQWWVCHYACLYGLHVPTPLAKLCCCKPLLVRFAVKFACRKRLSSLTPTSFLLRRILSPRLFRPPPPPHLHATVFRDGDTEIRHCAWPHRLAGYRPHASGRVRLPEIRVGFRVLAGGA